MMEALPRRRSWRARAPCLKASAGATEGSLGARSSRCPAAPHLVRPGRNVVHALRPPSHRPPRVARHLGTGAALVTAAVALTATSGVAGASSPRATAAPAASTTTVAYGSYRVAVPAGWPVIDLAANPTQCVRFDVHAVYLGHPGDAQQCPSRLTGVTEALLVEPDDATSRARLVSGAVSVPTGTPAPADLFDATGGRAQVVVPDAGVIVTAAYRDDPATVRAALDSGRAAGVAPSGGAVAPAAPPAAPTASAPAASLGLAPAAATTTSLGAGYGVGFAFDTCGTPSLSAMSAWLKSPYRTAGVYLGGRNFGCPASAITASWVSSAAAMGWGIVPIYVGYQAPVDNCGCASMSSTKATAAAQGSSEGANTVTLAKAAGLAPGNTLYFDMEGYNRTATNTASVMAYLSAWTKALHTAGYHSGVYSSSASGIADIITYTGKTGFYAPDNIWMANWNSNLSAYGDPWAPDSMYRGKRMHQFSGAHSETWGGVTIDIDSNAMNAQQDSRGRGVHHRHPAAVRRHGRLQVGARHPAGCRVGHGGGPGSHPGLLTRHHRDRVEHRGPRGARRPLQPLPRSAAPSHRSASPPTTPTPRPTASPASATSSAGSSSTRPRPAPTRCTATSWPPGGPREPPRARCATPRPTRWTSPVASGG